MLLNDLNKVTDWFFENYMVLNAGKYHFMCLDKNTENETFTFKDTIMNNSKEEKNTRCYNKLTFNSHIRELRQKASEKISALSRISNHLNDSQKTLLFNTVVKSQFNYCPLVWMFCSRTSNSMIDRVHKRALRVILGDNLSDFESLLQNNRDIRSHHKNIQSLMDSMFERRNEPYKLI